MTPAELAEKLAEIEERLDQDPDRSWSVSFTAVPNEMAVVDANGYVICATVTAEEDRDSEAVRLEQSADLDFIANAPSDISTLIKAVRERDWQPIETAPKNGTPVLIWSFGPGVESGYWDTYKVPKGWVAQDASTPRAPSFWMPLPQPPLAPNGKE